MASSPPSFLLARERERNRSTRQGFGVYAQHRAQQMALLEGLGGARIAILGAGNCNDVDLTMIARSFGEIHLFDLDGEALESAIARQAPELRRVCQPHEHDLTGVAPFLEAWRTSAPDPVAAQIAACKQLSPLIEEVGTFDTVMSTCMLSQVAINLRDYFGLVPGLVPALNAALGAAVIGHLMFASALTKPGGTLLVTSDCVTSQYPIREEAERHGALQAIFNFAERGGAFPGTDPRLVAEVVAGADFVEGEFRDAWIWELTPAETYLVYAIQATRRSL